MPSGLLEETYMQLSDAIIFLYIPLTSAPSRLRQSLGAYHRFASQVRQRHWKRKQSSVLSMPSEQAIQVRNASSRRRLGNTASGLKAFSIWGLMSLTRIRQLHGHHQRCDYSCSSKLNYNWQADLGNCIMSYGLLMHALLRQKVYTVVLLISCTCCNLWL